MRQVGEELHATRWPAWLGELLWRRPARVSEIVPHFHLQVEIDGGNLALAGP
jgi:hypothetical protein